MHINKRIVRPRGPFPSLPSGIDRVLKSYFDHYRKQGCLPPILDGKLKGKLATHPLTLGFNDARTKARLWGKLDDSVILANSRLAPLDHKTRASAPERGYTEKYYQLQMDVYTLLLERNGHRPSRTAYVVYYYPIEGKLHEGFPFGVTVYEIATDPVSAYDVFQAACRSLREVLPPSAKDCAFCKWAKTRAIQQSADVPTDLFA